MWGDDASCHRGYRHAVHRCSGVSLRGGYLSGIYELNRNRSLPVDKSSDLAAPEAVLKGCKGDRPVTVHRSGDVRFFTESVDKYVNSVRASQEDPVFMRVLRVLPKF